MENYYRKNCTMAVANYIIEKTNQYNESRDFKDQVSLTCKRIQKLLYFIEIEYMKRNNGRPLFEYDFFAWESGPVIPMVYTTYMIYNYTPGKISCAPSNCQLNPDVLETIDYVLKQTWEVDQVFLVKASYVGPWESAFDPSDPDHFQLITKNSMYEFWKNKDIVFDFKYYTPRSRIEVEGTNIVINDFGEKPQKRERKIL